jgi:CubicO group peptidase (beta-lactamase class C family)
MFTRNAIVTIIALSAALLEARAQTASGSSSNAGSVIPQLEQYIHEGMKKTGVPGLSIAIVDHDKVVYLNGFGLRKVGEPACVDPDTVFQLASVSKPVASTVVASLVGTGEVSWDDRIEVLDPEFQLSNPAVTSQVTIRDLLSHRSGLPTDSGDSLEDLYYSRPEILYRMRLVPLTAPFRTKFQYSNFGYTEGAIAAAKNLGIKWETLAVQRLFAPLHLSSTSYRFSDYFNSPNRAYGHFFIDGKPVARFLREPDAEAPAGSASSSARDLAEWLRLQLANGSWNGQQVVDAKALEETHQPQISRGNSPITGAETYYGLGWDVDHDSQGGLVLDHSGAFYTGAGTTVRFSPSQQIGILVLTNATPTGLAEAIASDFFDLYNYGKLTRDWLTFWGNLFKQLIDSIEGSTKDYSKLPPPNPVEPSQPLSSYVGLYHSDYYGDLEIREENNALVLHLPPFRDRYALAHWSGNTFTYYYATEGSGIGVRGIQFLEGGKQALVEVLVSPAGGVFTRVN